MSDDEGTRDDRARGASRKTFDDLAALLTLAGGLEWFHATPWLRPDDLDAIEATSRAVNRELFRMAGISRPIGDVDSGGRL